MSSLSVCIRKTTIFQFLLSTQFHRGIGVTRTSCRIQSLVSTSLSEDIDLANAEQSNSSNKSLTCETGGGKTAQ